ncbi:MAG: VWA domain-containing protein [Rhodospirillales bacterium]
MASNDKKLPAKKASDAEIAGFLGQVAALPKGSGTGRRGRLIFAMDATASREPTWDRAAHIQGEMFVETAALGGLEIQMAYYRGFGEFKVSPWLTESAELNRLMTSVFCLAGQTQIGKVLRHAIGETQKMKVNALVFVGDSIEEDVDELGAIAGELGLLGVPAFMFHEGGNPLTAFAFQQIAHLTKGAYCCFDSGSAHQLGELLSAVAVYAAGGRPALENLSKKRGGEVLKIAHQVKGN